jgi:hypothetical protein
MAGHRGSSGGGGVDHPVAAFLDAVRGDRLFALWWSIALRGLRRGGMRTAVVRGRLRPRELFNRTTAGYRVIDGDLKTAAGVRVVALDRHTVTVLLSTTAGSSPTRPGGRLTARAGTSPGGHRRQVRQRSTAGPAPLRRRHRQPSSTPPARPAGRSKLGGTRPGEPRGRVHPPPTGLTTAKMPRSTQRDANLNHITAIIHGRHTKDADLPLPQIKVI